MDEVEWSRLTAARVTAVAGRDGAVVIVPIGATEQHGPHLPVMTDWRCVQEIALRAARLMSGRVPAGSTLLGLYQGRPLPMRSAFESFSMPDRITLFQGPIERAARGPADVPRVIADTLWHEIAHYFGMDERQVRTAERRRARRFHERLR